MDVVAPYLRLRAVVAGAVHAPTGYLCNIKVIDRHLRELIPDCVEAIAAGPVSPETLVTGCWRTLTSTLGRQIDLIELQLATTPFLWHSIHAENATMMHLTQSFEFSAAHRLHCKELSEAENHEIFGKCANPNGHGHNYRVDVTVRGPVDRLGHVIALPEFEHIVRSEVIDRFDHKHLNLDCAEFEAINPSVENITQIVFDRLADVLPVELARVRVWETPKTYAEVDRAKRESSGPEA
jgi:6-pyruvoyltetrahydropterin/6-carboxytetrahydropterin synthase